MAVHLTRARAFKEHGDTFARLSTVIGAETRQLLVPRQPGPDGHPLPYRCTEPPALTDGIRVGEMGPGTLSCAVAEQVVNGVLDGTYPDVRAIAVHHRGALVLEEYFYRPTQTKITRLYVSISGLALKMDHPQRVRFSRTQRREMEYHR